MNIQITSRHQKKTSEGLKETLIADLERLDKFADKITNCNVILDTESKEKTVEIVLTVQGNKVSAKARADILGKAEAAALEKIERQLKKMNEKLKNHKAPKSSEVVKTAADEEDEEDEF